MTKRRRSRSEQAARKLLRTHGVAEPPVDVAALAQNVGAEVRYVKAPNNVSGMLFQEGPQIVIGVNSNHHPNRQRFTLAHELGHFLLHVGQQTLFVDEDMVFFRDDRSSKATDRKEIQANGFAAAVLMPEAFLLEDLVGQRFDLNDDEAVSRLAKRYQVSVQALTLRLANLGLVDGLPTPTS